MCLCILVLMKINDNRKVFRFSSFQKHCKTAEFHCFVSPQIKKDKM